MFLPHFYEVVLRVTYSPLVSAAQSDDLASPKLSPSSSTVLLANPLLSRISCLLHCPIDTPHLWPQVLSLLSDVFGCTSAQLFLPGFLSSQTRYVWPRDPLSCVFSDSSESDSLNEAALGADGATAKLAANAIALLWQYLGIKQAEVDVLWQHQATDLQAQLSRLTASGDFHIDGAQVYEPANWPLPLVPIFGASKGRQLVLLPLCRECCQYAAPAAQAPNCLGVIALITPSDQSDKSVWTDQALKLVELVGSQIYLAMRRSHLDQVCRTRSAYDQLTQLPDRVLFTQQLTRSIAIAAEQDTMLGVAFLDLDRFKNINDTLGHEAGDCLLQQVANRLKSCLRGYDVVARWGGDEFTLILPSLQSAEDVSNISERILQRLAAPFHVRGDELFVTASLGIALAPYDGEDGQTLLRNADAAMYQAKAKGRNNFQVYFEEINANARTQLNLETDLRKALDNQELFLHYQPQVDLVSGQWIGLEALIRWQHPVLGLIPPDRFIPIAEETGLIEPIGHWVLHEACAQYGRWHQKGFPQLRLAVNLSAHQFNRSYLVRSILQVLEATGFDPHYLELEVTESAAMHDVSFAIESLKKLSHSGVQIAMDDFGTGYSSLSVLKHFPLDTIKIDRSFVMDLVNSPSDAAIASTIIALAKGLNFKVLAEGIEDADQIAVLTDMGCDYAQGYWFSKPLSVQQIDNLLDQGTFYKQAKL